MTNSEAVTTQHPRRFVRPHMLLLR